MKQHYQISVQLPDEDEYIVGRLFCEKEELTKEIKRILRSFVINLGLDEKEKESIGNVYAIRIGDERSFCLDLTKENEIILKEV